MNDLWDRVMSLEGRTLRTVTDKPFDVLYVDRAREVVIVAPQSTGKRRSIERRQLEQAAELGSISGLKPSQVKASKVSAWSSAYVVGLLHAAYSVSSA